jgi:translation elongation factor EF-4
MSNVIHLRPPGGTDGGDREITRHELSVIMGSAILRVGQLKGVLKLATETLFEASKNNHELEPVWCSLDLAIAELDRLRNEIEACETGSSSRLIRSELLRGMPYEGKLTEPGSPS